MTENNQDAVNENLGWRAGLPDEFKEHDWAKTYSNVGDFFKDALQIKTNHDSMKTEMESAIFKPSENAKDEEWDAYYTKIGRPKTIDEYKFNDVEYPKDMPEHILNAHNGDMEKLKQIAHKVGLSQKQISAIFDVFSADVAEKWKDIQKMSDDYDAKQSAELKKEWGGKYEENLKIAQRGFQAAGELAGIKDKFTDFMNKSKLGSDPIFIKVFHAFGKAISEDTIGDFTRKWSGNEEPEKDQYGRTKLSFPSMQK